MCFVKSQSPEESSAVIAEVSNALATDAVQEIASRFINPSKRSWFLKRIARLGSMEASTAAAVLVGMVRYKSSIAPFLACDGDELRSTNLCQVDIASLGIDGRSAVEELPHLQPHASSSTELANSFEEGYCSQKEGNDIFPECPTLSRSRSLPNLCRWVPPRTPRWSSEPVLDNCEEDALEWCDEFHSPQNQEEEEETVIDFGIPEFSRIIVESVEQTFQLLGENNLKIDDPLMWQQWVLGFVHKTTDVLLTDEELALKFREPIIREQGMSDFLKPIVDTLSDALRKYKIMLDVHIIITICTNIISIAALLLDARWCALGAIAVMANVVSLVTTVFGALHLRFGPDIQEFISNLTAHLFGATKYATEPTIPGVSKEEMNAAFASLNVKTQAESTFDDVALDLTEGYATIRQNFSIQTENPVMFAVNSISWLISIAAIISIRAFGINMREALTHLMFIKTARELQQHLARDIQSVTKMIKEWWVKPKELSFQLYSNRSKRMEEMLNYQEVDIALSPILLKEWEQLVHTNDAFMANTMQDDGMKNYRASLTRLHHKMVDRSKNIYELAKTRGLRPVPVAFHLWSHGGGVGKSSFVTNELVPKANRHLGAAPGSQIFLKLGTENKYFPPMGVGSLVFVYDEFMAQSEKDPFLAHMNGTISETPYFLDNAFVKTQTFAGRAIFLCSNVPGVRMSGDALRINNNAAVAMWSRLRQFEVVNINRPVNQPLNVRDFKHDPNYKDLRFLPGRYVAVHSKKASSRATSVYPPEIAERIAPRDGSWEPQQLDGKWFLTADELVSLHARLQSEAEVNYQQKLRRRHEEISNEGACLSSLNISSGEFHMKPGTFLWHTLPSNERGLRDGYMPVCYFSQAREMAIAENPAFRDGMDVLQRDVHYMHESTHLQQTYSEVLTHKMTGNVDWDFLGATTTTRYMTLSYISRFNLILDGKVKITTSPSIGTMYLNTEQHSVRIEVQHAVKDKLSDPFQPAPTTLPKVVDPFDMPDQGQFQVELTFEKCCAKDLFPVHVPSDGECGYHTINMILKNGWSPFHLRQHLSKFTTNKKLLELLSVEAVTSREHWCNSDILELVAQVFRLQFCIHVEGSNNYLVTPGHRIDDEFHPLIGLKTYHVLFKDDHWCPLDKIKVQNNVFRQPGLLTPLTNNSEKFAVYIFGNARAGKTYFARQLAMFFNMTIGFPTIVADTAWWSSFGKTEMELVKSRPHVIVSDDSCFNHHYVSVYDNCHPKTIFINTSNEQVRCISYWKAGYAFSDFRNGYFAGVTSAARAIGCAAWEFVNEKNISHLPEGIARRVGLSGNVYFKGSMITLPKVSSLTINMADFKHQVFVDKWLDMSPDEVTALVWERFNTHLTKIEQPQFVRVKTFQEIVSQLGKEFKEPDLVIRAGSFARLQNMLSTVRSVLSSVTHTPTFKDSVYINKNFLSDKLLSVTAPNAFLIRVKDAMTLGDMVQQGVCMYQEILRMASDPAIRIVCGEYDIYCYRNRIYVNTHNVEEAIEESWSHDALFLNTASGLTERLTIDQVWDIIQENSDFTPTKITPWAVKYVKSHCESYRERSEFIQHRAFYRNSEMMRMYLEHSSKSWDETWRQILDSPYWKIVQIAVGIATLGAISLSIYKILRQEPPVPVSDVIPKKCHIRRTKESLTIEELSDSEDEIEAQTYDKNEKRTVRDDHRLTAIRQRYGPKISSRKDQMVVGLPTAYEETIKENNFECLVQKIADALVQVHVYIDGECKGGAYGLALVGRTIVFPAHYISINTTVDTLKRVSLHISYTERGTGEAKMVTASIVTIRRDLELVHAEVDDAYKYWQNMPDIRKYVVTDNDLTANRQGFLLVHHGQGFDRYYCRYRAALTLDRALVTSALCVESPHYSIISFHNGNCDTDNGFCGLPYILNKTHNHHVLAGFHIAAGDAFYYGANLTIETLDDLFSVKAQNKIVLNYEVPESEKFFYFSTEKAKTIVGTPDEKFYPEIPMLVDFSKDAGFELGIHELVYNQITEGWSPYYKAPLDANVNTEVKPFGFMKPWSHNGKVKLRKMKSPFSHIANELGIKNTKLPSIVSPANAPPELRVPIYDREGKASGESILWTQMMHSVTGFSVSPGDMAYYQKAIEVLFPFWRSRYSSETHRLLNNFEVLNGIQYGPFSGMLSGMERTSSVGIPTGPLFGVQVKGDLIELAYENGVTTKQWKSDPKTIQFLTYLEQFGQIINDNVIPFSVYKASPKAELVSKPKARLFCACGIEQQYWTTKYYGTLLAAFQKHHTTCYCQVGIDPIKGASTMWNRLAQIDGACICSDKNRWDKRTSLEIMKATVEVFIKLIMSNVKLPTGVSRQQYEDRLRIVSYMNIFGIVVVEGTVVLTKRGLPSGTLFTTPLNSAINGLYTCAVVLKWNETLALKFIVRPSDYFENVDEVDYGDDKVIRVSKAMVKRGFNYTTYATLVDGMFGTLTTPASKDDIILEHQPIEGSEFISRSAHFVEGGVWFARLKRSSVDVHMHWVSNAKNIEENLIANLKTLLEENLLWGQKEYDMAVRYARMSRDIAVDRGWSDYVDMVDLIPTYDMALQTMLTAIKSSCELSSPPANCYHGAVCAAREPGIGAKVPVEEISEQATITPTSSATETTMLPPRYHEAPFVGDLVKTMIYEHFRFAIRVLEQETMPWIGVWVDESTYKKMLQDGVEEVLPGATVVKYDGLCGVKTFALSLSWQLSRAKPLRLKNVTAEICNVLSKERSDKKRVEYLVVDNYVALTLREEEQSEVHMKKAIAMRKHQSMTDEWLDKKLGSNRTVTAKQFNDEMAHCKRVIDYYSRQRPQSAEQALKYGKELRRATVLKTLGTSLINQMHHQSSGQPIFSKSSTADAMAAPAMPSDVMPQLSNQQDNGSSSFGNTPAKSRIVEGGKMISISEASTKNWMSVTTGGGPIISVPVSTAVGTILFSASMWTILNDYGRFWIYAHERVHLELDLLINCVGTATWAGNFGVFVLPTKIPANLSAVETDTYLRTYAYEQMPLSSEGTLIVHLSRLINETQTNIAWDTWDGSNSTGPYVYIVLVTGYEQALANPDTAFQLQLLSRLSESTIVAGPNISNITKMIAAVSKKTIEPGEDVPEAWRSLQGASYEKFCRYVLGSNLETLPSIVINGAQYNDAMHDRFIADHLQHVNGSIQPVSWDYQDRCVATANVYDPLKNFAKVIGVGDFKENITYDQFYPGVAFDGNEKPRIDSASGIVCWKPKGNREWWLGTFTGLIFITNTGWSNSMIDLFSDFVKTFVYKTPVTRPTVPKGIVQWNTDDKFYDGDQLIEMVPPIRDEEEPTYTAQDFLAWLSALPDTFVSFTPTNRKVDVRQSGFKGDKNVNFNVTATNFRVERLGCVDSGYVITLNSKRQIEVDFRYTDVRNPTPYLFFIPTNPSTFEVPDQVSTGASLPSGYRKLEFVYYPLPVNSTTAVPVPSTRENLVIQNFIIANGLKDYILVVDFYSRATGRRAFVMHYNAGYNTPVVAFPANADVPMHAVFTGALASQLYINKIQVVSKVAALPLSDPALWTTIIPKLEPNQSDNSFVLLRAAITRFTSTAKGNDRQAEFEKEMRLYLNSVEGNRLKQNLVRQALRDQTRNVVATALEQTNWDSFTTKPRQVRIGQAAERDKQNAMILLSVAGGPGGMISKVGTPTSKGLGKATTSSQNASRARGSLPRQSPPAYTAHETPNNLRDVIGSSEPTKRPKIQLKKIGESVDHPDSLPWKRSSSQKVDSVRKTSTKGVPAKTEYGPGNNVVSDTTQWYGPKPQRKARKTHNVNRDLLRDRPAGLSENMHKNPNTFKGKDLISTSESELAQTLKENSIGVEHVVTKPDPRKQLRVMDATEKHFEKVQLTSFENEIRAQKRWDTYVKGRKEKNSLKGTVSQTPSYSSRFRTTSGAYPGFSSSTIQAAHVRKAETLSRHKPVKGSNQPRRTARQLFAQWDGKSVVFRRSQGSAISSGIEAGANAGLASQQHDYDKENMEKWFEGMSDMEKQKLQGALEQLEKSGAINSELMEKQFGFTMDELREKFEQNKELQGSQQEHEKGLQESQIERDRESQGSQQEHEKGLQGSQIERDREAQQAQIERDRESQGSSQAHEKDLQGRGFENSLALQKDQQAAAAETQRQSQLTSGALSAGLAGIPQRTAPPVISSGKSV